MNSMQAIVYTEYGSPDLLRLREVEKPVPGDGEVRVRIRAAAVNPLDWHYLRGKPWFLRISAGLLKPRNKILGADIAGEVETIGANVDNLAVGDAVYGDIFCGGFAEYACVRANELVAKPIGLSFPAAAAIPVAGVTALQCLRDQGRLQAGQRVLINGASGGVGTFAVQIAKALGGEVTGVCSSANVARVASIGADRVIDYRREDFTRVGQSYDLILDNVGNRALSDLARILAPGGTYLLNAYAPALMLRLLLFPGRRGRTLRMTNVCKSSQVDLEVLRELTDSGRLTPVIDREYPLQEVAAAIAYLETGHVRGKVVISMDSAGQR